MLDYVNSDLLSTTIELRDEVRKLHFVFTNRITAIELALDDYNNVILRDNARANDRLDDALDALSKLQNSFDELVRVSS